MAPLAALEALLNAAAGGDIPVDKETALDAAIEILGAELGAAEQVVAAALSASGQENRRPAEADPEAEESVHRFLRERRSILPVPALAEHLGLPVTRVHVAIEALRTRGAVEIVNDRSRVPVAMLRPGQ